MFAPTIVAQKFPAWRPSRAAVKAVTVTIQFAALAAFAVAGTIFLGLVIAAPIALPLAERSAIAVSTVDAATAQQLGSLWWLFAAGGVLSFGGAMAMIVKLLQHLAPDAEA